MLHCNMEFGVAIQLCTARFSKTFQPCCVVNLDCRRPGRERSERPDEIARGRDCEMCRQRRAISPLLDEDEPQRVLTIDMHGMRDASGLGA